MDDDTRALVITRRDGSQHTVLYDATDWPLIEWGTWCINAQGYAVAREPGGRGKPLIRMHRLITGLRPGDPRVPDHINGNKLDNRRVNLRIVTRQSNIAHQAIINNRGSSKYRGVRFDRRRGHWIAEAKVNYRDVYIGAFVAEDEAAAAVAEFRRKRGLPAGY